MNDMHMSHAMEFAYPQSMANCVTCHEGKLDKILTDANFTLATCKSCHPVTGSASTDAKRAPALKTSWPRGLHPRRIDLYTFTAGPAMAATRRPAATSGVQRDPLRLRPDDLRGAAGTKYSDVFTVAIDDASRAPATSSRSRSPRPRPRTSRGSPSRTSSPTAYDRPRTATTPRTSSSPRTPRTTGVNTEPGVGRGLGPPALRDRLGGQRRLGDHGRPDGLRGQDRPDGTIKRAEIAVMPALKTADGDTLALNAPSQDLRPQGDQKRTFADAYYQRHRRRRRSATPATTRSATTFHSGHRGGDVVVCRICHATP